MSSSITIHESKTSHKSNKKTKKSHINNDMAIAFSTIGKYPASHHFVPDNQVFKVSQNLANGAVPWQSWSSSVTLPTFNGAYFALNQLDQYTSLAAVFDQYRIDEVEVWIIPRTTTTTASGQNLGDMVSVIDYDDANPLTTYPSAMDYDNALTTSGGCGQYRRFKPHVAVAVYAGAFTSFANQPTQWLDAASPAVQHYGIKISRTVTDAVYIVDIAARVHLSFRNVR
jgi:hypothetical protein